MGKKGEGRLSSFRGMCIGVFAGIASKKSKYAILLASLKLILLALALTEKRGVWYSMD